MVFATMRSPAFMLIGGRTANLWAYDVDKKTHRQVTTFTDYDVKWPSIG